MQWAWLWSGGRRVLQSIRPLSMCVCVFDTPYIKSVGMPVCIGLSVCIGVCVLVCVLR